jgi:hypothetical protein
MKANCCTSFKTQLFDMLHEFVKESGSLIGRKITSHFPSSAKVSTAIDIGIIYIFFAKPMLSLSMSIPEFWESSDISSFRKVILVTETIALSTSLTLTLLGTKYWIQSKLFPHQNDA